MVRLKRLRLDKTGMRAVLSPLETDTLLILWKLEQARTREIHKLMKKRRKVALTSIAVTLDRLHQKDLVIRKVENGRGGSHYVYFPRFLSRQEFEESIVDHTVNKLINNFGQVAANYFYKRFSKGQEK